jgi:hypothetical protein
MRRRGRCVRPARSRVPATAIIRLVAKLAPVAGALLVFAPVASAQVHAAVSVQTGGGTRIVVKLTSPKPIPARQRPQRVSVRASGTTFKLGRAAGATGAVVNLGTWSTAALKGSAAAKVLALRGKSVAVVLGLAHGSMTLHSTVAGSAGTVTPSPGAPTGGTPGTGNPPGGTPGSTAPGPLFAPPGHELSGQAAFDSFKQYFLNSEFTDCQVGHWPSCAVENRYEHASNGSFEYHRCTPTSGSDINFYDSYQVTGAAQHANGAWVVEYTDQNGAGFYHWEAGTDGTVNGYYQYHGGSPEALTGYYWRQPAHLGDCYT